jgi:hypothetical protein
MSRRWRLVTLTVLLLLLGTALTLSAVASRPRRFINRESFEQIEEGMTREEVLAILRLPPGDHTVFRHIPALSATGDVFLWTYPNAERETWASDEGLIWILFDDDRVIRRRYADASGAPRRDVLGVLGRLLPGGR